MVQITHPNELFYPDLDRFKMKKITDDTMMLYQKRVCDIAATTTNKVKVYFNDEHMNIPNFNQYVNMFYDESIERIYEEDDRWAVCALYTPNEGGECVSYVNSICTYRGGTHVSYIVDNMHKLVRIPLIFAPESSRSGACNRQGCI